ncbi:hypothetical protein FKM82_005365 [Ascaphus truei]
MIRQLENKIDKMVIKLSSAGNINQTYLKILQNLEDELVHFPVHLNVMENTVLAYGKELESLTQMADEAIISREAIKMSLNTLEERVWKKRKTRESNLNRNKKMLIDLIDKQPPQKESAKKDLNMEFPSIVESETPSTGFKSVNGKSHSKQQRQIADIDQLKSVVECGELSEIVVRFEAQRDITEYLSLHIEQETKKRKALLGRLHELEIQHANLKFHQNPSVDR